MSDTKSILSATQANSADMFADFKSHTKAPRIETKTVVLNQIRHAYPDYHVTEVEEKRVSLFEYAAADKAKLVLDAEDEAFMTTKAWRSIGEGIEKKTHPGALKDEFRYAR